MDIAQALQAARLTAGLSQRALARAAGVPLSTVGRIERGLSTPRIDTLITLADALGTDLSVSFTPRLPAWLEHARGDIAAICREFGVRDVTVFGSVADGTAEGDSDVDLLVDLPDGADLLTLVQLERSLSELLDREVDVLPRATLREDFRVGRTIPLFA